MSATTTQSNLTLTELHTTQRTESIKTNSSNSSRLSDSLRKVSTKLDQKLKELKARVSNPKGALQDNEKQYAMKFPEAVDTPRDEGTCSINTKVNEKDEAKAARQEARRAKRATRRASFRELAKKIVKAIAISGAVVLSFIFCPVLIIVDLSVSLVFLVIRLLIELVELVCVPFFICFAW